MLTIQDCEQISRAYLIIEHLDAFGENIVNCREPMRSDLLQHLKDQVAGLEEQIRMNPESLIEPENAKGLSDMKLGERTKMGNKSSYGDGRFIYRDGKTHAFTYAGNGVWVFSHILDEEAARAIMDGPAPPKTDDQ